MLSFLFHQTFVIKINVPETNKPGSQITTSNHSDRHLPSNYFYEFPLCHSEPTTASTHGRHFKVAMIHPTGSRELTQLFHTGERERERPNTLYIQIFCWLSNTFGFRPILRVSALKIHKAGGEPLGWKQHRVKPRGGLMGTVPLL